MLHITLSGNICPNWIWRESV